MKNMILVVFAAFAMMLTGCMDVAMQYQPQADLAQKYDNTSKDDYLTIYYNVKEAPEGRALMMTVKNTGSIFMKNLSINYESVQNGAGSFVYKNLGNLKNRASKDMSIAVQNNDIEFVKLNYSFMPVREDAFLDQDASNRGFNDVSDITGTIIIYLTK